MIKFWEYLVELNISDSRLNELGLLGWELVTIAVIPLTYEVNSRYYFKRELLEVK